jgi:hypothetical protein
MIEPAFQQVRIFLSRSLEITSENGRIGIATEQCGRLTRCRLDVAHCFLRRPVRLKHQQKNRACVRRFASVRGQRQDPPLSTCSVHKSGEDSPGTAR